MVKSLLFLRSWSRSRWKKTGTGQEQTGSATLIITTGTWFFPPGDGIEHFCPVAGLQGLQTAPHHIQLPVQCRNTALHSKEMVWITKSGSCSLVYRTLPQWCGARQVKQKIFKPEPILNNFDSAKLHFYHNLLPAIKVLLRKYNFLGHSMSS